MIRWTLANGDSCARQFVELVPGRRIVFTNGRERPDVDVPPGSTTVEITLEPQATGTRLRLAHRGLPGPMADAHAGGWDHYLGRLAATAQGHDAGPDPFARSARRSRRRPWHDISAANDGEARFWELAEPLLQRPGVSRSTMMGLPCGRIDGAFFASCGHRIGDLLVKLPEARVDELIAGGCAHPFAPAGRRSREWAAVPPTRTRSRRRLIDEALAFVAAVP